LDTTAIFTGFDRMNGDESGVLESFAAFKLSGPAGVAAVTSDEASPKPISVEDAHVVCPTITRGSVASGGSQ
jgi:hypothetical protein